MEYGYSVAEWEAGKRNRGMMTIYVSSNIGLLAHTHNILLYFMLCYMCFILLYCGNFYQTFGTFFHKVCSQGKIKADYF